MTNLPEKYAWYADETTRRVERIWQCGKILKRDAAEFPRVVELVFLEDHEHPAVQYVIGELYDCGWFGDKERAQAREWFTKAAKAGHYLAAKFLAMRHSRGDDGYEGDMNLARQWHQLECLSAEIVASSGNATAMYELGRMHMWNDIGPENPSMAIYWWTMAAEAGESTAQYWLASEYRKGTNVPVDRDKEVKLLWKSAKGENVNAFNKLITYLTDGIPGVMRSDAASAQEMKQILEGLMNKRVLQAKQDLDRFAERYE